MTNCPCGCILCKKNVHCGKFSNGCYYQPQDEDVEDGEETTPKQNCKSAAETQRKSKKSREITNGFTRPVTKPPPNKTSTPPGNGGLKGRRWRKPPKYGG